MYMSEFVLLCLLYSCQLPDSKTYGAASSSTSVAVRLPRRVRSIPVKSKPRGISSVDSPSCAIRDESQRSSSSSSSNSSRSSQLVDLDPELELERLHWLLLQQSDNLYKIKGEICFYTLL